MKITKIEFHPLQGSKCITEEDVQAQGEMILRIKNRDHAVRVRLRGKGAYEEHSISGIPQNCIKVQLEPEESLSAFWKIAGSVPPSMQEKWAKKLVAAFKQTAAREGLLGRIISHFGAEKGLAFETNPENVMARAEWALIYNKTIQDLNVSIRVFPAWDKNMIAHINIFSPTLMSFPEKMKKDAAAIAGRISEMLHQEEERLRRRAEENSPESQLVKVFQETYGTAFSYERNFPRSDAPDSYRAYLQLPGASLSFHMAEGKIRIENMSADVTKEELLKITKVLQKNKKMDPEKAAEKEM
jgi:hypothetical protein